MIDFDLGGDLTIIEGTVERLAREVLSARQREFEAERSLPPDLIGQVHDIGLPVLELPVKIGGAGLGALAKSVVLEELAAGDPGAAIALDPLGPALYPLRELGGIGSLERFALPIVADQNARAVLVVDLADRLATEGDTVSGTVPWVPSDRADIVVILDRQGASVFNGGYEVRPVHGSGLRAAGAGSLTFAGALPADRLDGEAAAARALAYVRLHAAALLVGTARVAADISRQYATERVAFGKPIAHHQGLAFLIADMRATVDAMRLCVRQAAWMADQDMDFAQAAASAFVEAVEGAMFVGPNALQIFGGPGFMQDYPVEKYMREARTLGLMAGGVDAAKTDSGHDIELRALADIGLAREA